MSPATELSCREPLVPVVGCHEACVIPRRLRGLLAAHDHHHPECECGSPYFGCVPARTCCRRRPPRCRIAVPPHKALPLPRCCSTAQRVACLGQSYQAKITGGPPRRLYSRPRRQEGTAQDARTASRND